MINFTCLIVSLCTVILMTDCSMVVNFAVDPLQSLSNSSTDAQLPPECTSLIGQHLVLFQEHDFTSIVDNIDAICVDYQKVADCLRAIRSSSDQRVQIVFDVAMGSWEFMCSDKGRSALKVHELSPCFENEEKTGAVAQLIELCVNGTAQPNEEDQKSMCSYLKHGEECVYNILTEECGQPTAVFVHEMHLVVYRAMPIHHACFPEHSVELHVTKPIQM